ncbi:MAG TPA: carboxypeptidase-like regulatory domain-containing protein [Pyrinomonadaceae bacterium]
MVLRQAARKSFLLVLIFSMLLGAACESAVTTADGNVRDQNGRPLDGVTIIMESDANAGAFKKESEQRTSADGKFNFVTITAGAKQVRLTFTKEGYKTKQADIAANKQNVSDIVLEPEIK